MTDDRDSFYAARADIGAAYLEMLSFRELEAGWDGHGSKAIPDVSINAALRFLTMLPGDLPAPQASPSGDGTVDWYWRHGGNAANVIFPKGGKVAYFVAIEGGIMKGQFELSSGIPARLIDGLRRLETKAPPAPGGDDA